MKRLEKLIVGIAFLTIALCILSLPVILSGCSGGASDQAEVRWEPFDVVVSTTLAEDGNPEDAYLKPMKAYLHKWRTGENLADEYNSVDITDIGIAFGAATPVISDLYDGSHWTTWKWYVETIIDVGIPGAEYVLTYYAPKDSQFPIYFQCGTYKTGSFVPANPYCLLIVDGVYYDDKDQLHIFGQAGVR